MGAGINTVPRVGLLRNLKPETVRELQAAGVWSDVARALAKRNAERSKFLRKAAQTLAYTRQLLLPLDAPQPQKKPKEIDAEEIPIGATVRTPLGMLATVEGYRGYKREHRPRLVCRYLHPTNKAYDVALILPELVEVIRG